MVDQLVNSEANALRIATVESCFGATGQPLAIQGRVLVGEGILTKMCRKKAKPRQFFLFNDILVYGNIVMDKKIYNKQHIIPLEDVKLENLGDDGIMKNGWLIRTTSKSFAVCAATAGEKTQWMVQMKKCIGELMEKRGKTPSLEIAAVWIPDAEASVCMHCRKTKFTFLNRRHHCRKCGEVVCNPCSSKKFLFPAHSSEPLRVCLSCYDTLIKARDIMEETKCKLNEYDLNEDSLEDEDSDSEVDESVKHDALAKDIEKLTIGQNPTCNVTTYEVTPESVKTSCVSASNDAHSSYCDTSGGACQHSSSGEKSGGACVPSCPSDTSGSTCESLSTRHSAASPETLI